MRSLSSESTVGNAQMLETYILVKWLWILFFVLLVVGSIVLLAWATAQTKRSGIEVWKYSSLPLLFNGLETVAAGGYNLAKQSTNTVAEMESEAGNIKVMLGRSHIGGRNWKLLPARLSTYELNTK
jgi:hypothetical protein